MDTNQQLNEREKSFWKIEETLIWKYKFGVYSEEYSEILIDIYKKWIVIRQSEHLMASTTHKIIASIEFNMNDSVDVSMKEKMKAWALDLTSNLQRLMLESQQNDTEQYTILHLAEFIDKHRPVFTSQYKAKPNNRYDKPIQRK